MACHCGCNFDYLTGKAYDNGIGPADLFAEEWVEDHLAVLAAARQAAAAAMQLAAQRRAEAAQRQAVAVQVAQLQAAAEAHLEEMQALTAAHHHV